MSDWTESDSEEFQRLADVIVPGRAEMLASIAAALPFDADDPLRIVELSSGDGVLAEVLLSLFPAASLLALERSDSMRAAAGRRLDRFGDRFRQRSFQIDTLDWWDVLFGADVVVSSLAIHHLNPAKKQYLYKAVADRISGRGVLLIADVIKPLHVATETLAAEAWDAAAAATAQRLDEPSAYDAFVTSGWNYFRAPDALDKPDAIFHHLVWLKHAGFAAVDCVWLFAGHAVFGGYKSEAGASRPVSWTRAVEMVESVLRSRRSPAAGPA